MDERIDRCISKCHRKGFETLLFLWSAVNSWYEWCVKSWEGAKQIHNPEQWVFLEKNQYPICVKEDTIDLETVNRYNPIKRLYQGNHNHHTKRFNVLNVRYNNGDISEDISDFFTTVRWKSRKGPTLFEMIILWNLENKKYKLISEIREGVLVIQDDELNIHTISLSSNKALNEFNGWE